MHERHRQTSALGRVRIAARREPHRRAAAVRCDHQDSRREPVGGAEADDLRRARLAGGHRLHALLCDELCVHRARRRGRLPRRALQHRRGRPGLHRRTRRRADGPMAGRGAVLGRAARGDPRRRGLRRGVGVHPRKAAGAKGQPHRNHHDHVQLHRLVGDDLSAGQCADQTRPAVAGDAGVWGRCVHARDARAAGENRCHVCRDAAQSRLRALAPRFGGRVGSRLAHPLGLRAARRGRERRGGGLRGHCAATRDHRRDADFGRARRRPRVE